MRARWYGIDDWLKALNSTGRVLLKSTANQSPGRSFSRSKNRRLLKRSTSFREKIALALFLPSIFLFLSLPNFCRHAVHRRVVFRSPNESTPLNTSVIFPTFVSIETRPSKQYISCNLFKKRRII